MDERIKHITLFAFENKLKKLNIPFAYFDEVQKEAGLSLGEVEFYKMYAYEVYTLCTTNSLLKNDRAIKKLLKDSVNAKNDFGPLSSYVYKGDKPNRVTYNWEYLKLINDYCEPCIAYIMQMFGIEPFNKKFPNRYNVINFEVISPKGEGKALNVQRPWTGGNKELKDLDIEVIFCFLMKMNEMLNEYEFYIYPRHLKMDPGDYI